MKWYLLGWLPQYYDKLLHVLVTFALLVFGVKIMPSFWCAIAVLCIQIVKALLNRRADSTYNPAGDMCANGMGYILAGLYAAL